LVQKLISREDSILHSEVYNFEQPVSPHYAAAIANSKIEIDKILIPETQNKNMVIEGAGGVMVPIDEAGHFMIDLIEKLECEVVLVSQNYLGSINHSLLTIQAIHNRGLKIGTLIFNGPRNESSEKIIIAACQANKVKYVNKETIVGKETILKYSADFREI
jgi:dethiobiotin synthetase